METKIIIYGAGERGRGFYNFFEKHGKQEMVIGFCDRNYAVIENLKGKKVMSFEEAARYQVPFLISIVDKTAVNEIKGMIEENHLEWITLDDLATAFGLDKVTFNREFCADFHVKGMNRYFEEAEAITAVECFWGEKSPFFDKFKKLNLENVIELACGRGRHVPHYLQIAEHVTLVDILEENITYVKKRFADEKKISYYCNNGYNLADLETGKYTALFCYDAMVHFEMMDIYEYLKDIYRVLTPGGMVLIHHSNNTSDYRASFANAPHGRSFMSKDIFAYLAYRTGFEVLEQEVIDWGIKDLDAISLIQKKEVSI